MSTLAETIADLSLEHFSTLPRKCHRRGREWTILSTITLIKTPTDPQEAPTLKLISLATGTKCLTSSQVRRANGSILHDSHAEVLALRGANAWVLKETRRFVEIGWSEFLDSTSQESRTQGGAQTAQPPALRRPFMIKPNIEFYLFTTEAPCGDASMDLLIASKGTDDAVPWAEPAAATSSNDQEQGDVEMYGRGYFSRLGVVRRKPSRPDAEPSLSKSCSDKIAARQITGLLGFPADQFVQCEGLGIRGMVIYADKYDVEGYERAFGRQGRMGRVVREVKECGEWMEKDRPRLFDVMVLPRSARRFQYEKKKMLPLNQREAGDEGKDTKASNISTVWVSGDGSAGSEVLEVLINGVKQGYKQFEDRPGKESILCRRRLWRLGQELAERIMEKRSVSPSCYWIQGYDCLHAYGHFLSAKTYADAKADPSRQPKNVLKKTVTSSLGGWIRNTGDDQWNLDV